MAVESKNTARRKRSTTITAVTSRKTSPIQVYPTKAVRRARRARPAFSKSRTITGAQYHESHEKRHGKSRGKTQVQGGSRPHKHVGVHEPVEREENCQKGGHGLYYGSGRRPFAKTSREMAVLLGPDVPDEVLFCCEGEIKHLIFLQARVRRWKNPVPAGIIAGGKGGRRFLGARSEG